MGPFDNQVLVPITTAYYRLSLVRSPGGSVSISTINVQAHSPEAMDDAKRQVAAILRLHHSITGEDDFVIDSQKETIQVLKETTNTFVVFLGAIASITLLVGGIGIMNTMLVSVTERTREIGIRKAMGARGRDVLLQFLSEATLLSLGGGGVGVLLGLVVSRLLNVRNLLGQSMETAFSGDITLLALAVSAAVGLFFGIYPAFRASRLHPIEALRYE